MGDLMKINLFFSAMIFSFVSCVNLSAAQAAQAQLKPEQKQMIVYRQPEQMQAATQPQSLNTQQFAQLVSLLNQPRYQEFFQNLINQQLAKMQRQGELENYKEMVKEIRDASKPKKEELHETVIKETGAFIKESFKIAFKAAKDIVLAVVPTAIGTVLGVALVGILAHQVPGIRQVMDFSYDAATTCYGSATWQQCVGGMLFPGGKK